MSLRIAFPPFRILRRITPLRNVWSILLIVVVPAVAVHARVVIFNVAGSGTEQFQGTWPMAINDEGTVTGFYIDSNYINHGFLRSIDGTVLKFDVAGMHLEGTSPVAINLEGFVTGFYVDKRGVNHGFVRSPAGTITTFNAPGSCLHAPITFPCLGTIPAAINLFGTIVGYYGDARGVVRGFLRTADGKFSTFQAPGAGHAYGLLEGTSPSSVNDLGVISGTYQDSKQAQHGFVRLPDGEFVTFDVPSASNTPFAGTTPVSLNELGAITGYWIDSIGGFHGFVREPDGKITSFEAPGAGKGLGKGSFANGTIPAAINLLGLVTGTVEDQKQRYHGFIRFSNGTFSVFEMPGSGHGGVQGTTPTAINTEGVVTGSYTDANYVHHGFLIGPV